MHADFFTKPLQGMLFYRLRDLIMNIAPETQECVEGHDRRTQQT